MRRSTLILVCCLAPLCAQNPQEVYDQAWRAFERGQIEQSVELFEDLVRLAPGAEAELWQRGIVQYEAGRFAACRKQFELHRQVNPNDVENAAFHFFCTARAGGVKAARSALLPVGPDGRVPMKEIYEMLQGKRTPEAVLSAAGQGAEGRFFAHLYIGFYFEALGEPRKALPHFRQAAAPEFAAAGGLMHTVARVHLQRLLH